MKGSRKKTNIDEDLTSVLNNYYYYIYIIYNIPSISNCELEVVECGSCCCSFVFFVEKPTLKPSPGEHWQQPVLLLVSKHLDDVFPETQRKAIFIRACPKDRSSERLCEAGTSWTKVHLNGKKRFTSNKSVFFCLFFFLPMVDLFFPTSHRW